MEKFGESHSIYMHLYVNKNYNGESPIKTLIEIKSVYDAFFPSSFKYFLLISLSLHLSISNKKISLKQVIRFFLFIGSLLQITFLTRLMYILLAYFSYYESKMCVVMVNSFKTKFELIDLWSIFKRYYRGIKYLLSILILLSSFFVVLIFISNTAREMLGRDEKFFSDRLKLICLFFFLQVLSFH